ncbi:DUF397 domain-containing protein [Yinghuangia seranimata]|uniref:DUF397 domain-containing protein n=1 Tax=Yinghuangia seranimata TaxID=408067 RepID=UPI00248C1622|nr:DUF397 domain-containing protein [Yinghuangia seranimata]MDI2125095.1 DUF397 domain-containing protein [Yinghuangia seranimata]
MNRSAAVSQNHSPTWIKSSYSSGEGGECVEVAALAPTDTAVRDSKRPYADALRFTSGAWSGLVTGLGRSR